MEGFDRWLTDEQQRVWRSWLLGSARVNDVLDAELRPHGLDLAEYEILVTLSEAPRRRLRMSELAARVHQSRSRLTHTIGRMEQSHTVRRTRSKHDGRGVVAELTDDGFALLERTAPHHVDSVRRIFVDAVDPDDYAAVGRAMQAILSVELPDR